MMRCMFCERSDFETFDEVTYHQVSITTDAKPQCPFMSLDDIKRFDAWYSKYETEYVKKLR